jgi:hypothetical protein
MKVCATVYLARSDARQGSGFVTFDLPEHDMLSMLAAIMVSPFVVRVHVVSTQRTGGSWIPGWHWGLSEVSARVAAHMTPLTRPKMGAPRACLESAMLARLRWRRVRQGLVAPVRTSAQYT